MKEITIPVDWEPRNYQIPAWSYFENGGKRGVCVWHRRAGKDLFALNVIAAAAARRSGLYWHCFPTYNQGRKISWDGFTKDGRAFLSHFPHEVVTGKNNTDMRLTLGGLNSIYQVVGTEDPDRLVGTNPVGVVFSEYSLEPSMREAWDIIRPILSENGGWALFIYTARGHNHGYTLYSMAKDNPEWFCDRLTADDTKGQAVSREAIEQDRLSGMPEEVIQAEYYCSFEAPIKGAYYADQMLEADEGGRLTKVGHEVALEVNTAWDLGMDDYTAIWFFQEFGQEIRLINYYQNTGKGLPHYAKYLDKFDYKYGKHFAPFDIEVRELGTGKSRLETARSLGVRFTKCGFHRKEDGIESVRNLLPQCWFDEESCAKGIDALKGYRKQRDERHSGPNGEPVWKKEEVRDWTTHGADAFRTLAWAFKRGRLRLKTPQKFANSEYSIFNA